MLVDAFEPIGDRCPAWSHRAGFVEQPDDERFAVLQRPVDFDGHPVHGTLDPAGVFGLALDVDDVGEFVFRRQRDLGRFGRFELQDLFVESLLHFFLRRGAEAGRGGLRG